MARGTLLTYMEFNEELKIHTNARNFQLGGVISHKVKPIAIYSRILTNAYKGYTVTHNELLSIIETLK